MIHINSLYHYYTFQRKVLLHFVCLLLSGYCIGQETAVTDSVVRLEFADTAPKPIGGMYSVYEWLAQQYSATPFDRIDTLDCTSKSNGKVIVMFVINEQGQLTNPEIGKGIGKPYDNYCQQLIRDLPTKWIPGTKDGKPVKVRMGLPFSFCETRGIEDQKRNKKGKKKKTKGG